MMWTFQNKVNLTINTTTYLMIMYHLKHLILTLYFNADSYVNKWNHKFNLIEKEEHNMKMIRQETKHFGQPDYQL